MPYDYQEVHHASPEEQSKVLAKIRKIRIAMLTTQAADDSLTSRPMTLQQAEDDGTLWFFTSAHTALDDTIRRDAQVNVSFADTSDSFYMSTTARATFVDDRKKMESLWSPLAAAWFPEGPTDPTLRLLRVEAEKIDYWRSHGGKIVQMLAIAKAAAHHTMPGPETGEHGTFAPKSEMAAPIGAR
jgi:general stress protein 26